MSQVLKIRKDTVSRDDMHHFLNPNKQQFIGILGRRGEGKSYLLEGIGEKFYDAGFTVLDIWGASNLENAFWCIAREGHKKRYPITLLAPESLITPKEQIDNFNDKFFTKVPLVKVVKLPQPTQKAESEQNKKIFEILTETLLDCRKHRRILVFNPRMFPNEHAMFRTLEILLRNLDNIAYKYFRKLEPRECFRSDGTPKKSREEMTNHEKSWHKLVFLIREFGEVAPSKLKGDKSGESTLIKKSLLKFVRTARHAWVSGVIDYQNASDAESSIRNQIDVWLIKKWTQSLGGEYFQRCFDYIKSKRDILKEKYRYSKLAFKLADSRYPEIENLGKKWFYVKYPNDKMRLWKVPELGFQHKEPDQNWEQITGIEFNHDMSLVQKTNSSGSQKASHNDEKILYFEIYKMRFPKTGKKLKWNEVLDELSKKQTNNEVFYHLEFKSMSDGTISKIFSRMSKRYEKPTEKEESTE